MHKQVDQKYYLTSRYANLSRFISYYYQISLIKESGLRKILFIGVGDGLAPHYLKKMGLDITTYDYDENLRPDIVGDVRNLPFRDGEFDAVAAFEVLEHIPFNDFPKAVGEIHRVAKTKAFISVPCRHTVFELIFKFPLIRTLFKKDFLRLVIPIPLKFPGFEKSGQHYWEIDFASYRLGKIRSILREHFDIAEEERPVLHTYQKFFVLDKRPIK